MFEKYPDILLQLPNYGGVTVGVLAKDLHEHLANPV